jgi:hypothetical protein
VDNVNNLVAILTAPFGTQSAEAKINLAGAVEVVDGAIAKARREQRTEFEKTAITFGWGSALAVFGDLFNIGQTIAGLITDGVVPAILGIAGGASAIAQGLKASSDQFIWRTLLGSLFTPTKLIATDYNPAPPRRPQLPLPRLGRPALRDQLLRHVLLAPLGQAGHLRALHHRPRHLRRPQQPRSPGGHLHRRRGPGSLCPLLGGHRLSL